MGHSKPVRLETVPTGERKCLFISIIHHSIPDFSSPMQYHKHIRNRQNNKFVNWLYGASYLSNTLNYGKMNERKGNSLPPTYNGSANQITIGVRSKRGENIDSYSQSNLQRWTTNFSRRRRYSGGWGGSYRQF